MPVRGIAAVRRNFKATIKEISEQKTETAVYAILSQGAAIADTITPIDTSNLLNSRYAPQIAKNKGKTTGTVGYTARYAAWVHDAPGKLKGQPRAHFGKTRAGSEFGGGSGQGTYWSPNAEPGFLTKGFNRMSDSSIQTILRSVYGVK